MNEYGRSALEEREECERELVVEKEEAVGEGGVCEASDEQGHSEESGEGEGEGGGEPGAQVNASGAHSYCAARGRYGLNSAESTLGTVPTLLDVELELGREDRRRRALLELTEHQAHARGVCGGGGREVMQILRGLFCAAGRGGSSMCGGRARGAGQGSKSSAAEMRVRNSARLKGERRAGDVDGDLDDEGECMAGVEGKDEEGKCARGYMNDDSFACQRATREVRKA
jgi:hypothetical protein